MRLKANVPLVVMGFPETLKNDGTVISTEVTVPPVLAIVIDPAPFVIGIPVPATKEATTGAEDVEPINN